MVKIYRENDSTSPSSTPNPTSWSISWTVGLLEAKERDDLGLGICSDEMGSPMGQCILTAWYRLPTERASPLAISHSASFSTADRRLWLFALPRVPRTSRKLSEIAHETQTGIQRTTQPAQTAQTNHSCIPPKLKSGIRTRKQRKTVLLTRNCNIISRVTNHCCLNESRNK